MGDGDASVFFESAFVKRFRSAVIRFDLFSWDKSETTSVTLTFFFKGKADGSGSNPPPAYPGIEARI